MHMGSCSPGPVLHEALLRCLLLLHLLRAGAAAAGRVSLSQPTALLGSETPSWRAGVASEVVLPSGPLQVTHLSCQWSKGQALPPGVLSILWRLGSFWGGGGECAQVYDSGLPTQINILCHQRVCPMVSLRGGGHQELDLPLKEKKLEVEKTWTWRPTAQTEQTCKTRPDPVLPNVPPLSRTYTSGGPRGTRVHTTTQPGLANHTGRNAHTHMALSPSKSLHIPSTLLGAIQYGTTTQCLD